MSSNSIQYIQYSDLAILPNVEDLQPRANLLIGFSIAFIVLTWIAVGLRVYVRAGMIRAFGWDDATMVISLVTFTSFCALLIVIAKYSLSTIVVEAYATKNVLMVLYVLEQELEYVTVYNALYILTTVIIKIALAIFFLRIVVQKWQRRLIYASTGLYTTYGIIFVFVVTFRCGNPAHLLTNAFEGRCISNASLMPLIYLSGALNAITDWIFACLPITILWRSNMPRKAKISAGVLLGMGALGSVASIIRMAYLGGLTVNSKFFTHSIDAGLVSVVEPGLAIIAASLSTLRPLFKSMVEKTLPTFGYGRTKGSTNQSQKRSGRISFEDQKGFQLFDHSGSTNHTIIATVPRINVTNELDEVHEDPSMSRTGSQNSLVEGHRRGFSGAWNGRGVAVTRHVNVTKA